ncbi:MAG: hypothetical protein Q4E69_06585, partial [Bacilli bacterium]|nr:hypothetical protein [Bacilli bacterium]
MNTIQINFAFDFCCLIFLLFLIGIYLSKKNANNIDNKIYKQLLIWCFLSLVFNTIYPIFGLLGFLDIAVLLSRVYGFCLELYCFFLMFYSIVIAKQHDEKFIKKFEDKYNIVLPILLVISSLLNIPLLLLPLSMEIKELEVSMSGTMINYIFYLQCLYIIILVVTIALFRKKMDKSKLIPFYVLGVFSAVAFTVMSFFPSLVSIVIIITVITYLMYHTIENPDMQMVN